MAGLTLCVMLTTSCASVTSTSTERVISSETRLVRSGDPSPPVSLGLDIATAVESQTLVVRLTGTVGCSYRPLVVEQRERVTHRHANSTAVGVEVAFAVVSVVILGAGIVATNKANAYSDAHKDQCNDFGACVDGTSILLTMVGGLLTMITVPILAVDGIRQMDSTSRVEVQSVPTAAVEARPCGTAPWQNAMIDVRSTGPSGKARTDVKGEARFALPPGWKGPVEITIDGKPAPPLSL